MTNRYRALHVVTAVALLLSLAFALKMSVPTTPALAQDGAGGGEPRGPDGGPPEDLSAELVLGESRYIFDRVLPLDLQDLTAVAQTESATVYAQGDQPPFERVYVSLPAGDEGLLARYLPQNLESPDASCPAEAADLGPIDAGESGTFVFAGIETDLTPDVLQEGGTTSEGYTFYVGTEQPFQEFFVDAPDGLQRFVRTDEQGLPAILAGDVPFGGRSFVSAGPTDVNTADLTRVGCAGPFPLFATPGEEETSDELFALVGGQTLSFTATGDEADTMTADAGAAETGATPDAEQVPEEETVEPEQADATPPAEEPVETDVPEEEQEEATPDSGTTGVTAATEFPREITVDDARYFLDRFVPVAVDELTEIGEQDGLIIYARGEEQVPDRVYAAGPDGGDQVARYLAESLDSPDAGCLAEAATYDVLDAGDAGRFVFAGVENDLTPDDLQEVGATPDNQTIYAGNDQPITELFVTGAEGLLRYVILDEQGLPTTIGTEFPFAGQSFAFEEATDVDLTTLTRAGCAGPFPLFAAPEEAGGPFMALYLSVGDQVFTFRSAEAAPAATPEETEPAPASPEVAEEPTEVPDPTETDVPTEAPTEVPTETPVPTEVATETPVPPTETPVPTETTVPAETAVPTEAAAPTDEAAPAETPVENVQVTPTEEGTEAAAEAASPEAGTPPPATPTPQPTAAPPAELPQQIEVQNTTYVFNQVSVDVDVSVLVEVEVIQVQNVNLTIYAEQNVQGVAVRLYAATEDGRVVGRYVPAAVAQPAPPPSLPTTVEVRGVAYVFNEVEVNVDVQTLVQVQVVQVQNVSVTIYAEQNVQGRPSRLFCVSEDGQVVGQYVDVTVVVKAQVTVRPGQFQPAAAATLPPNAPKAAAGTAVPRDNPCVGDPGPLDDNGVPRRLPRRVQLRGVSYTYVRVDQGDVGKLTRVGCVGAFEALSSDGEDVSRVVYLRISGASAGQGGVFRFEAIKTVGVKLQVKGQPRTITLQPAGDQPETDYSVRTTWQRSVYSSITVILFAEDPASATPALLYGYDVDDDVIGEYAPEGEIREASPEMQQAAEASGLNPDVVLAGGQRYILVAVWEPSGSTANGWVTFYSSVGEGSAEVLLGRDPRQPELIIYQRSD
jgi:hypothetical protein